MACCLTALSHYLNQCWHMINGVLWYSPEMYLLHWIIDLTHWGRVTHICVSKLTIIGSDNGLSPGRRQAIIWTNAGILLIGALGTNVSEISIKICTFSLKKMLLKMSSGQRRPSCLDLNVLTIAVCWNYTTHYPCDIFRLMQAWLFRNPFWTTDRVKGLVTAVPQVGVNSWVNYSEFLPSFYLWIANTFECHKIFRDLVKTFSMM